MITVEHVFDAKVTLSFKGLTMGEIQKLEHYIHEGLEGRDWGLPHIVIEASLSGEKLVDRAKKKVSKEDLLAAEKKGASKC